MDGYHKSVIDVRIKFDKERERQFKDWLDKEYRNRRTPSSTGASVPIKDLLAIKPSNLSRFLNEDFARREREIQNFRKVSLNALASPLLTRALVKKTTETLSKMKVSAKEQWKPFDKFKWTARIVLVLVSAAYRWRRYSDSDNKRLPSLFHRPLSKAYSMPHATTRRRSIITRRSSLRNVLPRLGFDMAEFSKKDGVIPSELQDSMTKLPSRRTQDELVRIQKFCRTLGILSNFPINRELDASKLIAYERYDNGRVICLQGSIPQRFYYILSGRVSKVRAISLTNGIEKKYFGELHKGQTTDAEELQSKTIRDSSLICSSDVEILLFEREDFMELLNSKGNKENSTSTFLRSIDLFLTFPVELLTEEDDSIITKYYPKDAVIVSNMKEAAHFYVIKTGICKILRRFVVNADGMPISTPRYDVLPRIGEITHVDHVSPFKDYNDTIDEARRLRDEAKLLLHELDPIDTRPESSSNTTTILFNSNGLQRKISVTSTKFLKKPSSSRKPLLENDHSEDPMSESIESSEEKDLKLPMLTRREDPRSTVGKKGENESSESPVKRITSSRALRHSLLYLGSLKKGDVYGIDSIVHRAWSIVQSNVSINVSHTQPDVGNLILLSEGAECVLIRKSSFLQKADFCTLAKIVSSNQNEYINDNTALGVDKAKEWNSFKKKTVKSVVRDKRASQLPV